MPGDKGACLKKPGVTDVCPCSPLQTLEAIKRKQFAKYHAASAEERTSIELNPYVIFHQALKNCEPVLGLISVLRGGHFYQVTRQDRPQCRHR